MNIKTPISWIGNKTSILPIIYAVFPLKYKKYVEPFGGSGAVLLGKKRPDKFEVYNDYNSNLVNLFRCMRDRTMAFIRKLGFLHLNSRDDFSVLKKFFKEEKFEDKYLEQEMKLTEIMLDPPQSRELKKMMKRRAKNHNLRRAVMYFKLLRYSYSSSGKSYGARPLDIRKLFGLIQQLQSRLENVVIENKDFKTGTFYCDRIGFKPVEFDTSQCKDMFGMRVLYVTPHHSPLDINIKNDLTSMQKAVDGLIEPIYEYDDVILVGNEEAKLRGMEGNRKLESGTIIAGPFCICGDGGENFTGLTDEQVEKYMNRFSEPEDISQEDVEDDIGFT